MNLPNQRAIFQVSIPGDFPAADPLDLWQAGAPAAAAGLPAPAGGIWRADLPADPQDAAEALESQAFLQLQMRQALADLPRRLQRDLSARPGSAAGQAYTAQDPEVSAALRVILQARAAAQPESSFSTADDLGIGSTVRKFEQFIAQVHSLAGQLALVESARGGLALAVTRVAWNGQVSTYWGPGAGKPEALLHHRLLQTALATRQDWLRLLSLLSAGILRVSSALALTPFLPLTIWTAWKYIQVILEEVRQLQPLPNQPLLETNP